MQWGGRVRRLGATTTAIAVVALSGAAAANASSIFFLRNSNIWVANPDGSNPVQVTTDGTPANPYDFVAAAKTTALLAFHRGGSTASQFGTLHADGTGRAINSYNASMEVGSSFFTRLDAAGDRMTWAQKAHTAAITFFADSVGVNGSAPQEIYHTASTMDARHVTFGDPGGGSLLFTDPGTNYSVGGGDPCDGTDAFNDILVRQVAPPRDTGSGPDPTAIYCANDTMLVTPALSADGRTIAAEADGDATGSTGRIVTIPIDGGVTSPTAQSPLTSLTPANSGDTLPDFSPDGSSVAFQGPGPTIAVVPSHGGTAHQILTNASVPAWSPYTLVHQTPPPPSKKKCVVPKLGGRTIGQARTALKRAGCTLGSTRRAYSSRVKSGHVLSQSRRAGTNLPVGSRINLVISKGKKPRRHHR